MVRQFALLHANCLLAVFRFITILIMPAFSKFISRFRFLFFYTSGVVFYLWLVNVFKMEALLANTGDDGYYLRQANNLISSGWLGHFDNMTLARAIGYPAFIAISHKLHLPLLLSHNLFYIFSVSVFCFALRLLVRLRLMLLIIFLGLLFNPAAWSMYRAVRDHVYMSLSLLTLACAIGVFLYRREAVSKLACWAIGLGCSAALFWNTRDEGIWLVPAILFILAVACVSIYRTQPDDRWKRIAFIVSVPVLPILCSVLIATVNYHKYGVFITTETSSGSFVEAYAATSRVKHQNWQRYYPVPAETRERLYKVSPAYAELRPFFEEVGRPTTAWCSYAHPLCGKDYGGGWYMWVLLLAATHAGHYTSAPEAQAYYKRLANEINQACDGGKLDCLPQRNTFMPPLRKEYVSPVIHSIKSVIRYVISFDLPSPLDAPLKRSQCPANADDLMRLCGDIYPCAEKDILGVITGWVFSPVSEISFGLEPHRNNSVVGMFSVQKFASPDVAAYAKQRGIYSATADNARFAISFYPMSKTYPLLVINGGNKLSATIDLTDGRVINQAEGIYLDIESTPQASLDQPQLPARTPLRLRLLSLILVLYQKTFKWIVLCSLAAFVMTLLRVFKQAAYRPLCAVMTAVMIAVSMRVAVIAFIDATSFWSIYYYYLGPVYPLLIFFSVTGLQAFADSAKAMVFKKWSAPTGA